MVDVVPSPTVSAGAVPVGGGGSAGGTGSVVRVAAPTAAQATRIAKSAQLAVNGAKGSISEALVYAKLAAEGVEIVGTQVSAKLASGGRRVIDILVKVGDEVVAIEVKSGGPKRGLVHATKVSTGVYF